MILRVETVCENMSSIPEIVNKYHWLKELQIFQFNTFEQTKKLLSLYSPDWGGC